MSPLSSDTLMHFTPQREYLINILSNEFRPRYSFEEFGDVLGTSASPDMGVAIPMVCFCDIPLSQTAAHMKVYGRYALGLTKEWGKRNGVAPVLYTYPNAGPMDAVWQLLSRATAGYDSFDAEGPFNPHSERLMCFIKPYDGLLRREGHEETRVRFYDEREWRYVPSKQWPLLNRSEFGDADRRNQANTDLNDVLPFEPSDVRYVVVQQENEIAQMVEDLRKIKSPKYPPGEIDLLCTRIVAAEQIAVDY